MGRFRAFVVDCTSSDTHYIPVSSKAAMTIAGRLATAAATCGVARALRRDPPHCRFGCGPHSQQHELRGLLQVEGVLPRCQRDSCSDGSLPAKSTAME
jgi:hypothetical protein